MNMLGSNLSFPPCPRTFRLSYTTARPILFCTCKPIRTRYPNQSEQDTHGLTPSSTISHSFSPSSATTTKSRPIEKKVLASAQNLRLGLTMTPTPLVTPTTRPATRYRARNILPEHEPSHHCDFFTASRRCSRCRKVIKGPQSSVCFFFQFFPSLC